MAATENLARPLRLALVTTELRPGGAERCLTNLALRLDRAEFEPHVYSLAKEPATERSELVQRLRDGGVPVEFVGVQSAWQAPLAVGRLRKLLAAQSPDVVQSFLFHANVATALAAKSLGVPLLAGLRVAQRERLRNLVDRTLAKRFAGHVCVSEDVANSAIQNLRLAPECAHVIPNGVDADGFDDLAPADLRKLGIPEGQKVILFLGRFEYQKGADILLKSARQFLGQLPDCHLVLLGEGPQSQLLNRLAKESGLSERIHFAGWRPDAHSFIASAELLVAPSRWEGMSNVVLEAMGAGKAVAATDVEGMRQLLGPGAEAQVVPTECPAVLAERVGELMNADGLRDALGIANRQRALSEFTIERAIAAYASLFRETVAKFTRK